MTNYVIFFNKPAQNNYKPAKKLQSCA